MTYWFILLVIAGLVILAWRRGWKWRALMPVLICYAINFVASFTIKFINLDNSTILLMILVCLLADIVMLLVIFLMAILKPKAKKSALINAETQT